MRSFEILQLKEKEADLLKRKIIGELAKGDLPVSEREDLMRLARQTDDVIDWINETGRILVEFNLKDMPDDVKKIDDRDGADHKELRHQAGRLHREADEQGVPGRAQGSG